MPVYRVTFFADAPVRRRTLIDADSLAHAMAEAERLVYSDPGFWNLAYTDFARVPFKMETIPLEETLAYASICSNG